MARWKARIDFLLSVIELLFLSLAVEALQGKMCQNSLLSGGLGQFEPAFQGKRSSLWDLFGWRKTRHILLSFSEDCVILRSDVLTQYRRVVIVIVIPACDRRTDRRTDGIAVARLVQSLLAMRALRRAATTQCTAFVPYCFPLGHSCH